MRQVLFGSGIHLKASMVNVTDNSDHADPLGISAVVRQAFSDRIFIGPILFRKSLIDDDDRWRVGSVGFGEKATLKQWRF